MIHIEIDTECLRGISLYIFIEGLVLFEDTVNSFVYGLVRRGVEMTFCAARKLRLCSSVYWYGVTITSLSIAKVLGDSLTV